MTGERGGICPGVGKPLAFRLFCAAVLSHALDPPEHIEGYGMRNRIQLVAADVGRAFVPPFVDVSIVNEAAQSAYDKYNERFR